MTNENIFSSQCGPAFGKDIAIGDTLVAVDRTPCNDENASQLLRAEVMVGTVCILTISRNGRTKDIWLTRTSAPCLRTSDRAMKMLEIAFRDASNAGHREVASTIEQAMQQVCRLTVLLWRHDNGRAAQMSSFFRACVLINDQAGCVAHVLFLFVVCLLVVLMESDSAHAQRRDAREMSYR